MEGRMTIDDIKERFGKSVFGKAVMMSPASEQEVEHGNLLYRITRSIIMWHYGVRIVGEAPAT